MNARAEIAISSLFFASTEPCSVLAGRGVPWLAVRPDVFAGRALRHIGNNRTDAARRLNVNRQLLYAKLKRYGIDVAESGRDTESG